MTRKIAALVIPILLLSLLAACVDYMQPTPTPTPTPTLEERLDDFVDQAKDEWAERKTEALETLNAWFAQALETLNTWFAQPRKTPITPIPETLVEQATREATVIPSTNGSPMTYTVRRGDTLSEIAKKFGTSVEVLVELNKDRYPSLKTNPKLIQYGWELTVPSTSGSGPSMPIPTPTAAPALPYRVGVYYYPWHFDDFHDGKYLREHLKPRQEPMLGEYNDRNKDVIKQHLEWSRYAGIEFWVTSWWGPGGREDVTILDHILQHPDLGDFKIAVLYETWSRTNEFTDYSNLGPDMTYLADKYFGHPNYLKIDGKPVLFIYLTRVLSDRGKLQSSLDTIRSAAEAKGYSLFIVGDHVFGSPPGAPGDIALLDGITNYDVYGSMGATGYATQTSVDAYYAAQAGWKALAHSVGVAFVPAVIPGFNDRGVRDGHDPLSRKLAPDQEFGSLFRSMVQKAKEQADFDIGRMIMVTSWNEWHEDTQIEPIRIAPATSLDDSKTGSDYTNGLSYEGYGERYLRILREETVP